MSDEFRREVKDKLEVYRIAADNPIPIQAAIVKKQCEDFLVELHEAELTRLRDENERLTDERNKWMDQAANCASIWCPYEKRMHAAEAQLSALREALTKSERYTQHLPQCRSVLCKTCNVSRSNGQHEDDHYGARPHVFEPQACTCGLTDTLALLTQRTEDKKEKD